MEKTVKIRLDALGLGSLEIDGCDISDVVEGISLQTMAGSKNQLLIQLKPVAVSIDGEFEEVQHNDPFQT